MSRIFLSYHTPDRAIALALKGAIERALPGADVFVDQTHLRHGHLWQPALFEAIARCQAFLILVANRLGDWQKVEYYEARDRKAKEDGFILLPLVIADPAKGPTANLPGMAQLHWIESTEPAAPEPLARIVAALQTGEVSRSPEPWRTINPYRGLIALDEQDADFFFGRERETSDIICNMIERPNRLIALVGNSGVGKSSLVQAGVMGSLKRRRWPGGQGAWPQALKDSRAWAYLTMKPGENPTSALASEFAALWFPDSTDPQRIVRRNEFAKLLQTGEVGFADLIETTDKRFRDDLSLAPPPRVLLYIDQGEELYARTPTVGRKLFSDIIAKGVKECPGRLIVMTSQRADYYGELLANRTLFPLTKKIDVPPLDSGGLALVLREPARVLGVGFESDDLIGHIVKAAEDQPGALPLLADLFTDLWERMRERGDGTLRVSDRREIIQLGAALSKRADQFLAQYPDQVEAVKRLFTLRLAHVPRLGDPVRSRWVHEERAGGGETNDAEWALVELLAGPEWRLLVTGEKDGKATAEVAHEVLLKRWPALQRWLEDEREFLVWRGESEARLEDYEKVVRAGTWQARRMLQRRALLMGLPLDIGQKWLKARRQDIPARVRAFIEASAKADRKRYRQRQQAVASVLLVGIIAGLGWMNQAFVEQQLNWYTTMRPYQMANFQPHILTADAERALKPGQTFRECSKDCPEMVVVPAGAFMMGSPETEHGRSDDEGPQQKITFAKPFGVSKFDVTFADWDACVSVGGCPEVSDSGMGRGSKPVVNVNWDEAKQYAAWLSRMTGQPYRLLTEAEFEYAARAGRTTAYPWGDEIGKGNANCDGYGSQWDKRQTSPVGSFNPNGFGLYDMQGNVWQWVEDCYQGAYNGAAPDGSARTAGDCSRRVARGVPGTTLQPNSGRPSATASPPSSGSAASASVSGGRLSPESSHLYLLGPR